MGRQGLNLDKHHQHFHGFHVYIPPESLTAGNLLCEEAKIWLEAQTDTEWHVIDGVRPWPASPIKSIAWFMDDKLASMFKLLFG